jgi:tetratricopeptide (TPR) repeat protein
VGRCHEWQDASSLKEFHSDDKTSRPLQAADLIAREAYKHFKNLGTIQTRIPVDRMRNILCFCTWDRSAGTLPASQAFPIVRSQAEKALELDPVLPEGQAMLGVVAASLDYDWKEAARRFRLAMARDPVPVNLRFQYALSYLLRVGRPVEALEQLELGLQEDPLNPLLQINRAGCLAAAGRDEQAAEGYREALELNPGIVGALGPLAAYHASRGEIDQALVLCEKAYALAPLLPHAIGLLAGLLKRTGATCRAEELLGSLQPGDAFGAPRGLAVYHWCSGNSMPTRIGSRRQSTSAMLTQPDICGSGTEETCAPLRAGQN